ncbi:hypothetical protein ANANG_G00250870 [Anguilla anguilla]|uniref:Uncharacterized protein n=1 Tax=Anguilla anguilla TaxID=7936 RepID=A0A9D3LS79_ANGAN|nr:hypothetical protein ANANG_G00250870 [Anguilla anguilla]
MARSSMATPAPTRTNATDDVFPRVSRSDSLLPDPVPPPPLLLLFPAASAGTTLHTIITMPRAISPTPSAHRAYCDPELLTDPELGDARSSPPHTPLLEHISSVLRSHLVPALRREHTEL